MSHKADILEGLPQSIETERLVLAAILKHSVDFWECRSALDAGDFSTEAHRTIWRRLAEMHDANQGIDYATVAQCLFNHGELEACGGFSYLADLDNGMPGLPAIDQHVKIVRDKSLLRRAIGVAESIKTEAILGTGNPTELLTRAERMLIGLGLEAASTKTFSTPGEVILKHGALQKYLERGRETGVPLGYPGLDRMTCGMRRKQLWILAASTGCGKSTFARNVALNAAYRGYPGAFVSLEMSEEEITDGFICAAGEIDTQVIRRGLNFERDRVRDAAARIADLPIYIRDKAGCTVDQLHGELRKLKAERGITYAIVDYLQLMSAGGRYENRNVEVGVISRGLKLIAMDLDIPVMALSQLKRLGQGNPKPSLQDLRDSGSLEQDANVVMFLWSEKSELEMTVYPTEVTVAKQRGGPVGMKQFGFQKSSGIFREFEQIEEQAA